MSRPINTVRSAAMGNLLDEDFRQRVEVAYEMTDEDTGWLSTSIKFVRCYPDEVTWLAVGEVREAGGEVEATIDGHEFVYAPSYPIVVRDREAS